MPYITEKQKNKLYKNCIPESAGELNYLLTIEIRKYINKHDYCYQTMNDIVGALECCKQEFIRRIVNPYEDTKIKENGDIY